MNKNILAIILIVISIGLYFTVTSGMLAEARAVKAVNDQYSEALSNAAEVVSNRDRVLAQYNSIAEADQDKLDKMIPSTVDGIRLIIDVNNIAIQHGFTLPDMKAVAAPGAGTSGAVASRAPDATGGNLRLTAASFAAPVLDTVALTFTATAEYNQFISFLQALESNLRVMDITRMLVTALDTGGYTFQVQMQTYWLRQ